MDQEQAHSIQRQVYELYLRNPAEAAAAQEKVSRLQQQVSRLLETLLTEQASPDILVRLDKVELDLGTITLGSLEQEVLEAISRVLPGQVQQHMRQQPAAPHNTLPVAEHHLELIRHFLLRGYLPWWLPAQQQAGLEQYFGQLLKSLPQALTAMLRETLIHRDARRRLVHQFPGHLVQATIHLLEPAHAAFVITYADDLLAAQQRQPLVPLPQQQFGSLCWELILMYLLEEPGGAFNKKSFVRHNLYHLAAAIGLSYGDLLFFLTRHLDRFPANLKYQGHLPAFLHQLQEELITQVGLQAHQAAVYHNRQQLDRLLAGGEATLGAPARQALLAQLLQQPDKAIRAFIRQQLRDPYRRNNFTALFTPADVYRTLHYLDGDVHQYLAPLSRLLGLQALGGFRLTESFLLEHYLLLLSHPPGLSGPRPFIRQLISRLARALNLPEARVKEWLRELLDHPGAVPVADRALVAQLEPMLRQQDPAPQVAGAKRAPGPLLPGAGINFAAVNWATLPEATLISLLPALLARPEDLGAHAWGALLAALTGSRNPRFRQEARGLFLGMADPARLCRHLPVPRLQQLLLFLGPAQYRYLTQFLALFPQDAAAQVLPGGKDILTATYLFLVEYPAHTAGNKSLLRHLLADWYRKAGDKAAFIVWLGELFPGPAGVAGAVRQALLSLLEEEKGKGRQLPAVYGLFRQETEALLSQASTAGEALLRKLKKWLARDAPAAPDGEAAGLAAAITRSADPRVRQYLRQQIRHPLLRDKLLAACSGDSMLGLLQYLVPGKQAYIGEVWAVLSRTAPAGEPTGRRMLAGILLAFLAEYQGGQVKKTTFLQYVLLQWTSQQGITCQQLQHQVQQLAGPHPAAQQDIRRLVATLTPAPAGPGEPGLLPLLDFLVSGRRPPVNLNDLVQSLAQTAPQGLKALWRRHGPGAAARQRLVASLSDAGMHPLLQVLMPGGAGQVRQYTAELLALHEQEALVAAPAATVKTVWWELVLLYLVEKPGSGFNEKAFMQHALLGLTRRFGLEYDTFLALLATVLAKADYAGRPGWRLPRLVREMYAEHRQQLPQPPSRLTAEAQAITAYLRSGDRTGLAAVDFPSGFNRYFLTLIRQRPAEVQAVFRLAENEPATVKRLLWVSGEELFGELLAWLAPGKEATLQAYRQVVGKNDLVEAFPALQKASLHKASDELLLRYLVENRGSVFNTRSFLQAAIARLALMYQLPYAEWVAYLALLARQPSFDAPFRNLMGEISRQARQQVPRPLPPLAVPRPPRVPDPPALPEKQAPPVSPARQRPLSTAPEPGERLYLSNAGLVLFWPYLSMLFERLGFLENNKFKTGAAASGAVHALQYLVSGHSHSPESLLVLNKVLCGLHPATPVLPGYDLDAAQTATLDGLLQALIANWPIIGQTSVAGLRETFLQREGLLTLQPDYWQLHVARKAFDMLVDRLPWSLSIIKPAWMPLMLQVEWQR